MLRWVVHNPHCSKQLYIIKGEEGGKKSGTQARLQGRNVVNITQRRISNRLLTESIEYNRSNIAVLPVQSVLPVLVQYYRYGTTGTVLHLPVPGYWYDYTVYSTDYQYKYYCPIYRYGFISTVIQVISSSIQITNSTK